MNPTVDQANGVLKMRPINRALGLVSKRAERSSGAQLLASFVDVGEISQSMRGVDHQVMYGRRGTGKTHVLSVISDFAKRDGAIAIQIDLRTLGSTGGIYSDYNIPLAERATRLLADLLWAVHDGIMEALLEDEGLNWGAVETRLDLFRESISQVKVVGQVVASASSTFDLNSTSASNFGATISSSPQINVGISQQDQNNSSSVINRSVTGDARHRIHFGSVARYLGDLSAALGNKRIWLLLDEWSEIPLDLQPYLADLLRRAAFPVRNITVKIAAIEQRTHFRVVTEDGGYIGIEIGADGAPSLTLDDFMVFDSDAVAATSFFRKLLWKHVTNVESSEERIDLSEEDFAADGFTQVTAIQELARAAEGVPRDGINVAALAARIAGERKISVSDIRSAARQWYQQSKEQAVSSRPKALDLLQWIRQEVIAGRKARAFMLPTNVKNDLVDYLYDSRVIHIIKKSVSSNETPGIRYNAYAIDYGCYVDLISTINAPQGLFQVDENGAESGYVDVPTTDYRSIRRAILDVAEFERQ